MMDDVGPLGQDRVPRRFIGLLDSLEPEGRVRAIDAAIQRYWEAENWITARAKGGPACAGERSPLVISLGINGDICRVAL